MAKATLTAEEVQARLAAIPKSKPTLTPEAVQARLAAIPKAPPTLTADAITARLNAIPKRPRPETTWGETIGGVGADLMQGVVTAGRSAVNKVLPAVGAMSGNPLTAMLAEDLRSKQSDRAERAIGLIEQAKSQAYINERGQKIVRRDADGNFDGFNIPTAESVVGTVARSLPQAPEMLLGGGWARSTLGKIFAYGMTNAGAVAPEQYESSKREALRAGKSPEEAELIGRKAGGAAAVLSFTTGGLGFGLAAKVGAAATNPFIAAARGAAVDAPFELVEESGQKVIEDVVMGRPVDKLEALDRGLIGMVASAPTGSVSGVVGNIESKAAVQAAQDAKFAPNVGRSFRPEAVRGAPLTPIAGGNVADPAVAPGPAAPAGAVDPKALAAMAQAAFSGDTNAQAALQQVSEQIESAPDPKAALEAVTAAAAPGMAPAVPGFDPAAVAVPAQPATPTGVPSPIAGRPRMTPTDRIRAFNADFNLRSVPPEQFSDMAGKRSAARRDLIAELAPEADGLTVPTYNGGQALVTRDTHPGAAGWRVTYFDANGSPSGHSTQKTPEEAVERAIDDFSEKSFVPTAATAAPTAAPTETRNEVPQEEATGTGTAATQAVAPAQGARRPLPPSDEPRGELHVKGKNAQAVKTPKGAWYTRVRKAGQWQPWVKQKTFDPSPVFGYQPASTQTGVIRVGKLRVVVGDPKPAAGGTGPKPPKTLLERLAKTIGLDRAAFAAERVGQDQLDMKIGTRYPFRKEGGMTPEGLREWMIDEGFIPRDLDETGTQGDYRDALDILSRALAGERIVSESDQDAENAYRQSQLELEPTVDPEQAAIDERDALLAESRARPEPTPEEVEALEEAARASPDDELAALRAENARLKQRKAAAPAAPAAPAATAPATATPTPDEDTTSTKNAAQEEARAARGEEPLPKAEEQRLDDLLGAAQTRLKADPALGEEIVQRAIDDAGVVNINPADEAVLQIYRRKLENERNRLAGIIGNEDSSKAKVEIARKRWDENELKIQRLDLATHNGGRAWGLFGRIRQEQLKSDFSRAALIRKEVVRLGRPLTKPELAVVEKEAEAIAAKQEAADAAQKAELTADVLAILHKEAGVRLARTRPSLDKLKAKADASREALRKMLYRTNAGVDPAMIGHVYNIGRYAFARGAQTLDVWLEKMQVELGEIYDRVKASLPEVFAKVEETTAKAKAKAPPTVREAVEAVNPAEQLTHRDVYNVALAHVREGVRGEDAIMAATHADLKAVLPDLDEKTVRELFTDYGKARFPSRDEALAEMREVRTLVRIGLSIDRELKGLSGLKTGQQRDKASLKVREKMHYLNDLLKKRARDLKASPEHLAGVQERRATNLRNLIELIQKQIKTGERTVKVPPPEDNMEVQRLRKDLAKARAELKAIDDAGKPVLTPEQKYQQSRAKSLEKQLADLKSRFAAGDFSRKPPRAPRELSAENRKAQADLNQAKREFALRQFSDEMAKKSRMYRFANRGLNTLNLARAIMTSLDVSAVARQAGFIVIGNPKRLIDNFVPMLRAMFSEPYRLKVERDLRARQSFAFMEKSGLYVSKSDGATLADMEEQFMSRWLERSSLQGHGKIVRGLLRTKDFALAPVRGSARGFSTFLNLVRADTFDALTATLAKNAEVTEAEGKAIANYINVATGRGNVGGANWAVGLNTIFFAPKLVVSRFNLLLGTSFVGGSARTKSLIAVEYAKFLTGVSVIYALGSLAHDDDDAAFLELNSRSANFGKMRFGNAYVDPLAGLAQVTVLLTRVATGEKKTGVGEIQVLRNNIQMIAPKEYAPDYDEMDWGGDSVPSTIGRFLQTKLAPIPGAILNTLSSYNVIGEPTSVAGEALSLITPLSFRNVYGLMTDNGVAEGTAIFMLELLGMSVQYRDPIKGAPVTKEDQQYFAETSANVDAPIKELSKRVKGTPPETWQGELNALIQKYPVLRGATISTYAINRENMMLGRAGDPKPLTEGGNVQLTLAPGTPIANLKGVRKEPGIEDRLRLIDKELKDLRDARRFEDADVARIEALNKERRALKAEGAALVRAARGAP